MRVDLHFTPHQTEEASLRERVVVAIDVLRSSTTIATALQHGAKEIIPAATVESAVKISTNLFGDVTLLGGERNGKAIPGFHLGNSPLEYTAEKVRGKSIIFSSTNGSPALAKARYARHMIVCGFVNMSAVVEFIHAKNSDFIVLCAGRNGQFSLEDSVCAGLLVHRLAQEEAGIEPSDAAAAALLLYKAHYRSILKMIKKSEHGRFLEDLGFGEDLNICAAVDTVPVLPQLVDNVLKLRREVTGRQKVS